jgi:thiamine pyrophosphokinase
VTALILCNGEPPSEQLLLRHLQSAALIICTDGAVDWVQERGIRPQIVIGDMDSTSPRVARSSKIANAQKANLEVRPTREDECEIIHCGAHDQQENTDAEKAVLLALERGATRLVLLGGTGQRLDHTLGNVALATKYRDRAEIIVADDHGELTVLSGRRVIPAVPGTLFSLLALTADVTLDTEGLKWPLRGPLEVGTRGLSNEAVSEQIVIDLHSGVVALITLAPVEAA